MKKSPKLRTVDKVTPPYKLGCFPNSFVQKLGENLVYLVATKSNETLSGEDWERVFADCISANWKPSNVGLDDVVLDQCCWGAKTVKASLKNIAGQTKVRLISGRNSPTYSFGEDRILEQDPNIIGEMVLDIWNERVSSIRKVFKFARTVVLVKGKSFDEFIVFELDTIRYDNSEFTWKCNKNGNLKGFDLSGTHKFTWQPHGSQFTIIEDIPDTKLHIKIRKPDKVDKTSILKAVGYDPSWIEVL